MHPGKIVSIHIAPWAGAPMQSLTEVDAIAGRGLAGDRYCESVGTYSKHPGSGRALTLIESEAISALKRDYNVDIGAVVARRNLVTEGVALNHFVEQNFRVGNVILRGTRLCEPCSHLERLTQRGALRGLIHRGGLRAEILTGGIIRVDNPVTAVDD